MDDEAIIALLSARDERALGEAQKKYGEYCRSIALNIRQNESDCAECLNDVWLRLWQNAQAQEPGNLKLYLASVTRNLAFDRHKEQRRLKRGGASTAGALEEIEDLVSGADSVEEEIVGKDLARSINAFLRGLPAKERGVFVRRYYFVDDTGSIARRFSMTKGAVLTMLSRTRAKLKEYLLSEGYDL